jgi:cobalt-zinc-cadmium efflux system outer membrane protein
VVHEILSIARFMKQKLFNYLMWVIPMCAALSNRIGAAEPVPLTPGASSPSGSTNQVTLENLVSEALDKNPELRFYQAEIAAAKAGRKTAGLLANPELSGSAGQKSVRGPGFSAEGVVWAASVMQPFEWPGRISLRKAIANRDIELAELGFERFRMALVGRMRLLAFGLFASQEKAAAASEVANRFQALREVLIQRDAAGLTPLLETRVIEATELSMQRKATEAILAAQAALLEMNQLRGATLDARFAVAPRPLAFPPAMSLETLTGLARTNNFELRSRAAELAQQGFRVDLARNERFPAISVGPMISEERAGDRERTIGIGVSLPLPIWNRNGGNIESAKARRVQAEVSLTVAEREIQRKVIEAALTYETKLNEMSKWRPDSVQHFQEAANLADRHYRIGAVPISTYVELQKQYLEAVESLLSTKKEALEAAQNLELLTGRFLPLSNTSTKEQKP